MKVLAIQLKRVGDLLLTTPALAGLQERFPDARVTLVTDPLSATLAPSLPAEGCLRLGRGLADAATWAKIATGGFDACVDFSGTDRSALVSTLSRAPLRITWGRFRSRPLRHLAYNRWVDSSVRELHTADHAFDLIRPLGVDGRAGAIALSIPEATRNRVRSLLRSVGVEGSFAVIHPGSAREEKFWLAERWREVIHHLEQTRRLPVILSGSQAGMEQRHLAQIRAAVPEGRDFSGRLSLLETAALIQESALLCGVDSAPLHFCDAFRTPCVALYGPTNPYHWRPRFAPARVLRAGMEDENFRPGQKGAAMEEIGVGRVIAAIEELAAPDRGD